VMASIPFCFSQCSAFWTGFFGVACNFSVTFGFASALLVDSDSIVLLNVGLSDGAHRH
jgi:hypothetical protein